MQKAAPRLLIAGTNSGCGKTTVTCAILQALVDGGVSVAAAKCGPDYIDPMFHREIIGAKSSNLDPFFFDDDTLRFLLAQNGAGKDVTVIEGVMGYYDGIGLDSSRASTFEVAQRTESPVVLVLNAKGAGLSVLAVLDGFLHFATENRIRGVILNGCTAMSYPTLARAIEERFGVRACGFLPQMPDCSLESRHLGLITAAEVDDLKEKMQRLAAKAQETIDLNALLQIAKSAPPLTFTPPDIPAAGEHVRIGVARDRAFCFYYEDSLELLRRLGAELVPFSPLSDERLPEDLHGLYLGGGYPELYAERLEAKRRHTRFYPRGGGKGTSLHRRVRRLYVPDAVHRGTCDGGRFIGQLLRRGEADALWLRDIDGAAGFDAVCRGRADPRARVPPLGCGKSGRGLPCGKAERKKLALCVCGRNALRGLSAFPLLRKPERRGALC